MTARLVLAHLRYAIGRHGWPAVLGLALLALAVGGQLLGVERMRAQTAQLQAEYAAARLRLAPQPSQQQSADQRLAAFQATLPNSSGALEAIDVIHRSAEAHGVKLANGEYRLVRDNSAQLLRYQITLPARATYPRLRAWLGDVMHTLPSAALDEFGMRREDASNDNVEARVRLTLFLRAD